MTSTLNDELRKPERERAIERMRGIVVCMGSPGLPPPQRLCSRLPRRLGLDGGDGGLLRLLGRRDVLGAGNLDVAGGEDDLDVGGVTLV